MQAEKYGFKVGIKTDNKGWRTYDIYRWDWRHNKEIIIVSTVAHGSIEQVQAIARDHARILKAQQSKRISA